MLIYHLNKIINCIILFSFYFLKKNLSILTAALNGRVVGRHALEIMGRICDGMNRCGR